MKPSGEHTHPEMSGGGSCWPVIAALILLAAIAGPAAHAVTGLLKALAITAVILAALALTALAAVVTYRIRKSRAALPSQKIRMLPLPQPPELEGTRAPGRGQEVHLHFHGVSADDVAAILDRVHAAAGDQARALGWEATENPGRPGLTGHRSRDPRSEARRPDRRDAHPGRKACHD